MHGFQGKFQKMKVFISYAREDHGFAARLRDDLESAGLSPWLDTEDLLAGQNWRTAVRQAIKDCSYFIAVLSSRSVSKQGFVQKELKLALEILGELPPTKIFLIPIRLDECEPTEEILMDLHWADFSSSYEEGFNQVLRVLAPDKIQPPASNGAFTYKLWYRDPVEEGLRINLGKEIASGGEGTLYEVKDSPGSVAKIYHPHMAPPVEKLEFMAANPLSDMAEERNHVAVPWIRSVIKDRRGRVIGYEMPRIPAGLTANSVYNPRLRAKQTPVFTWRNLHMAARSLASTVSSVHAKGYIIGDLSESNVLVHPPGLITLLDADSFQVRGDESVVYRCRVGRSEYTPPELQGIEFSRVDRTEEHDRFALAVLLFLLLMEGTHPYLGAGEPALLAERIRLGLFPFGEGPTVGVQVPLNSPPFGELHPILQGLFIRCFRQGHTQPSRRPSAREWEETLSLAEKGLLQCSRNKHHFYQSHCATCTWCRRTELLGGHDPFPSPAPASPGLDFAENPEPRCPCVLVVDTSEAMKGHGIRALSQGLRTFQDSLRRDRLAALRVEVSVIAYGPEVELVQGFVTADEFVAPNLEASGPGPMGKAVEMALETIERRKAAYKANGIAYYRPWVFLLSNGSASDNWRTAAERVKTEEARGALSFIPIAVSESADFNALSAFTSVRTPVMLRQMDSHSLFVWLSTSVSRVSKSSIGEMVALPPVDGWTTLAGN